MQLEQELILEDMHISVEANEVVAIVRKCFCVSIAVPLHDAGVNI